MLQITISNKEKQEKNNLILVSTIYSLSALKVKLTLLICKAWFYSINIAGIPRMSNVTIFQPDHFVLSTMYYSNLTFRSP